MQWLVEDAEPNDALFLHCTLVLAVPKNCCSILTKLFLSDSGHRSQQEDEDGDEKDGIDEGAPPHLYI